MLIQTIFIIYFFACDNAISSHLKPELNFYFINLTRRSTSLVVNLRHSDKTLFLCPATPLIATLARQTCGQKLQIMPYRCVAECIVSEYGTLRFRPINLPFFESYKICSHRS